MRRLLLLLLALAACSEEKQASAPAPPAVAPAPAATLTPTAETLALRTYEHLLNGRRAATMRVEWKAVERDGKRLIEDVTETISREQRDMAGYLETFDSESKSTSLRTEDGEMVSQETVTTMPGREDKAWIERTRSGYKVRMLAGASEETYEVPTDGPVMLDAEAFLGKRIREGEVKPGDTFSIPLLSGKRVVTATLKVIGRDDEGPGLKVVETTEGQDALWWFAEDGSVVRLRIGVRVIRRDDRVRHGDLPRRPAGFQITLPADEDLPRIFTTRRMLVDVVVETDETTKPPRIPESPFTEVVESKDDRVTLALRSHDDPKATCPLPIDPKGFEEHLKPSALMEVDDPGVRRRAKDVVGDAKDAREAARRIADFVFTYLHKGSSKLLQPTVRQILEDRCGDCSEHALLFTGLCRAAGIPVRQCSGYVCIGSDWGSHSWCEVWVGRWIGADPTTNEIGTRARYILLARLDEPVEAGRITPERTRIVIRRAEYDDGVVEFGNGSEPDPEVLSGIRLGPLPEGWEVIRDLPRTIIRGPGFMASASIEPDHGYRSMDMLLARIRGGEKGGFGGRPAAVSREMPYWVVPLGRELLTIGLGARGGSSAAIEDALAKVLKPTLEREE